MQPLGKNKQFHFLVIFLGANFPISLARYAINKRNRSQSKFNLPRAQITTADEHASLFMMRPSVVHLQLR
jgi:hypothetical protein